MPASASQPARRRELAAPIAPQRHDSAAAGRWGAAEWIAAFLMALPVVLLLAPGVMVFLPCGLPVLIGFAGALAAGRRPPLRLRRCRAGSAVAMLIPFATTLAGGLDTFVAAVAFGLVPCLLGALAGGAWGNAVLARRAATPLRRLRSSSLR